MGMFKYIISSAFGLSCMNGNFHGTDDTRKSEDDCLYCFTGFVPFGKDTTGQSKCMKEVFLPHYQRDPSRQPESKCYQYKDPKLMEIMMTDFCHSYMYLCFCKEGDNCNNCSGSDCPITAEDKAGLI